MSAKKNIIKDLRKEIARLEDKIKGQAQHINHREKMYARTKRDHEIELGSINIQTNNIARHLKERFVKEITWDQLVDNPESKIRTVREVISSLHWIAKPREEEE